MRERKRVVAGRKVGGIMKRFYATAAAVGAMALATTAYADEATGTIKAINLINRMLTLDDGNVYVFTAAVNLGQFKVGDKVTIAYVPATPIAASALGIFGSASALSPAS
jgi:outer membrane lipoprotein SlyB